MTAPFERLGGWSDLPFFRDHWPDVARRLAAETRTILPPEPLRFAALERTQPDDVRAVILGQDPYPTAGHANGLAFSVTPDTPLPRSLSNIYRELEDDIGARPTDGDLSHWADQGVLLLNTSLSVPQGDAKGHATIGWTPLIRDVLDRVASRPTAFVLWGRPAQTFAPKGGDHLIVASPHPSPLSARTGFFGSRPFSRVNDWLVARGEAPIHWA